MNQNNMRIWSKVNKTDPKHTKKVEVGRKFTSIDAHYQIQMATELFGPVGEGWGYTVEHSTIAAADCVLAVADVILWHGTRDNCFGPIRGMAELLTAKGRIDDDAGKKATTDAVTKALSQLGFNADVFLGMFDDNKYVASLRKEFAGLPSEPIPATVDAADRVDEEQAIYIRKMQTRLLSDIAQGKDPLDVARYINDQQLDADGKVYLWSLISDSKIKSTLKKAFAQLHKEAQPA